MTLTRKTRASGTSLVITIPSQIVKLYDINQGDLIEIIPLNNAEIKIKKHEKNHVDFEKGDIV
jgi:antitoxin component of MazEF toxin-antitoxin module